MKTGTKSYRITKCEGLRVGLLAKWGFSLAILFILICALQFGCNGANAGQSRFKTAHIECGAIERRVIATGRIEPLAKVEIRSKANGIIKTITVDDGDPVSKGQVIIELDKDILISQVNEARAALERVEAAYELTQIEASTVEMDSAQMKHDRLQKLFAQGLATKEQIEDAETALSMAKQNYRARNATVTMAKAELSAAKAALARAQDELKFATITSPMDGVVLRRHVDEGAAVASVVSTLGTLLMTLGDVREMHMVGDVDESDIGFVREGMPTRISVESYPGRKFHGVVKRISPLGVEKEKIMNFEVEVSVDEAEVPLRTNMTADAEIIVEEHKDVLLVPQTAIRYERNQSYVETPDPGEETGKRRVDITLGINGTNFSELLSGLEEGSEVVVTGAPEEET